MEEKLEKILLDLNIGYITVKVAKRKILRLFAVSGQSELLLAFKDGWLSADDHSFDKEERLKQAIDKWKASNSH